MGLGVLLIKCLELGTVDIAHARHFVGAEQSISLDALDDPTDD